MPHEMRDSRVRWGDYLVAEQSSQMERFPIDVMSAGSEPDLTPD
jgi:hypothetical protein